jgi:hypothetical protein
MSTKRLLAAVLMATALPPLARAAEYQVTSSSQIVLFNDLLSSDKNQGNLAQYLRLNFSGLDKEGKYSIVGYGRLIGQFTTEWEPRPELISGANLYGRLYYLYLDARDVVPDRLDLRLGRTYVTAAALTGTLDGAALHAHNLGIDGFGATAFGGRRVTFDNLTETGNAKDVLAGGSLYFDTVKSTHLEASYARKWVDGDYAQDFAAFDLRTSPLDLLTLTGRVKYDLGASRWAEILVGASVVPFDPTEIPLVLKAEFYVSQPSFDQYSFYRYFNVNRYQELGASAQYEVLESLQLNVRYAYEDFDDDQHAHVVEGGIGWRPLQALSLNASYLNRNGFGGRVSGLRCNGSYVIGDATLAAGVDFDDFRRELARTGTSKRYWAGVSYAFNKVFSAQVHGEDALSYVYSHALQGTVALNATF